MNIKQAIYRRAWPHLKKIREAQGMVPVDDLVYQAYIDTFRIRNLGVYQVRQRQAGIDPAVTQAEIHFRVALANSYRTEFFQVIMAWIPPRLKRTGMYKDLAHWYGVTIFHLPASLGT